MEWLGQNWVWVLFIIGFVAMHLFGHGGHGGHSGHGGSGGGHGDDKSRERDNAPRASGEPQGHHH